MKQSSQRSEAGWFLFVPRLLAACYAGLGALLSLAGFLILLGLITTRSSHMLVHSDSVIIGLTTLVVLSTAVILGLVAKGFWYFERWSLKTATVIHILTLFGQISGVWSGIFIVEPARLVYITFNATIVIFLLCPPVRRLFQ